MSSHYFCAWHTEKMKACESEALRRWSQMMQRGVKAYVECRIEAANIYLNAAFEIVFLRSQCPCNGIFTDIHMIKPAEMLLQLQLMTDSFNEAHQLLQDIKTAYETMTEFFGENTERFLAEQFERIEITEKVFFGEKPASDPKQTIGYLPSSTAAFV